MDCYHIAASKIDVATGNTFLSTESNNVALVVEVTEPGAKLIEVWVAEDGDGPSCMLSPAQARQCAVELIARADYIDPAGA